jgi:hypothetical protein
MKPEFPLFFDVPFYVSLQKRRVVFLLNYHKKLDIAQNLCGAPRIKLASRRS